MPPRPALPVLLAATALLLFLGFRPPSGLSAGEGVAGATHPSIVGGTHPSIRLVRVEISHPRDFLTLHRLGLDVLERETPDEVLIAATDPEITRLESEGFQFRVIEADLESATRRRLGGAASDYHTFEEVVADLDRLRAVHPDLVGPRTAIGVSWEGRPLWAVKISDHPELDEDEPEVLYDALHHAREPIGMETLLYAMHHLVENYDRDPEIHALVDGRELWFVPVVNPDGYIWGGIGGMWRKNRRANADGSLGVDLNRNYGYQWGYDDLGSSPLPSSQTYRGPAPFSEPEARAMRDFILSRRFVTGMTLHAYSEINLLPYGWAEVRPADAETYDEIAHDLEGLTGYPHGQPWEILYFSNGRTQDWQVHEAGMVVIEPEIGSAADGFWPPPSRILVLAKRNLPAILYLARAAGAFPAPVGLEVEDSARHGIQPGLPAGGEVLPRIAGDGDGLADPGETVDLVLTLRNKGFAGARGITIRVTSASSAVCVHRGSFVVDSLPPRTTRRLDWNPVRVGIAADAPSGEPVELELEMRGEESGTFATAKVTLVPGSPDLVFSDGAESGLAEWITTGGWGVKAIEGGHAFTDSPGGRYPASTDNALILTRALDLSRATRVELRYRETLSTEPWEDLCFVEAGIPGQGWTPLVTLPGGVESRFRERRLSLDAFAGKSPVRLRFRLTSNHSNQRDGWTIDDIEVWAYGRGDTPPPLAAASSAPPAAGAGAPPSAAHPGTTAAE